MSKVAVGMSGGVDSSVAAYLLKEKGYDVTGVFMECWNAPGCRTDEDRKDALKIATKIGIPFKVLDYKKEYREKVVQYFYDTYESGLTPNPDVMCNQEIKFGLFYKWAKDNGFEYIATGHYARVKSEGRGVFLQRAFDQSKDQSYFLYRVSEEQLRSTIFPLGEMLKEDVRKKAVECDLHVSDKPDSMGICFIGDVDVKELLKKELGDNPGEVVFHGGVVGRHEGLWFHTIGQRGGFELEKKKLVDVDPSSMDPLYVVDKNSDKNQLIVGHKSEVYRDKFKISDVNWVNGEEVARELMKNGDVMIRIRNLGEIVGCKVNKTEGEWDVKVDKPFFGVAAGQSGVLYLRDNDEGDELVLGGGVILY